jgi:transcriptional regulator with XRE-family HTH domain
MAGSQRGTARGAAGPAPGARRKAAGGGRVFEEEADREAQEWGHRLRLYITERGRSQRSVERQLGWGAGYLSQLLRPEPPHLKVKHVLAVLRALEVPPAAFFAGLYDLRLPEPADDLRHMSKKDLQAFISHALRGELARMIGSGPAAGEMAPGGEPRDSPDERRG